MYIHAQQRTSNSGPFVPETNVYTLSCINSTKKWKRTKNISGARLLKFKNVIMHRKYILLLLLFVCLFVSLLVCLFIIIIIIVCFSKKIETNLWKYTWREQKKMITEVKWAKFFTAKRNNEIRMIFKKNTITKARTKLCNESNWLVSFELKLRSDR